MTHYLGNSSEEQDALRPIALWAAMYATEALAIFESRHPTDARPRQAIEAACEFGKGKKRDKTLRLLAFAALKAQKGIDDASRYAAQAAMLTTAIAYTHTDLQTGLQGVRQARHILGPIVYAARAIETAADDPTAGDMLLQRAAREAPPQVGHILLHMPPQPHKNNRTDELFETLDTALRSS